MASIQKYIINISKPPRPPFCCPNKYTFVTWLKGKLWGQGLCRSSTFQPGISTTTGSLTLAIFLFLWTTVGSRDCACSCCLSIGLAKLFYLLHAAMQQPVQILLQQNCSYALQYCLRSYQYCIVHGCADNLKQAAQNIGEPIDWWIWLNKKLLIGKSWNTNIKSVVFCTVP